MCDVFKGKGISTTDHLYTIMSLLPSTLERPSRFPSISPAYSVVLFVSSGRSCGLRFICGPYVCGPPSYLDAYTE